MRRAALTIAVAAAIARVAAAHELTPALLSFDERAPDRFDVEWRLPIEAARAPLAPVFPAEATVERTAAKVDAAGRVEAWTMALPGGLAGRSVRVAGPSGAVTDVLVRVSWRDGRTDTLRLVPGDAGVIVPARAAPLATAASYLGLGVQHILLGFDHLAFVSCLLLLARGARRIVAAVTAFTASHSVTLAWAALGWPSPAAAPVEAAIALSIVVVARSVAVGAPDELAARRPALVAFAFGWLHGLGFAGALGAVGLPRGDVTLALTSFNIGVELGQLAFVAAGLLLARALASVAPRLLLARAAAYAIGAFAFALLCDRVAAFW